MARAAKQTCKVLAFPSRGDFEKTQRKVAYERWDEHRRLVIDTFSKQYQELCFDAPSDPALDGQKTSSIDVVVFDVAWSLLQEVGQLLELRDRTYNLPDRVD